MENVLFDDERIHGRYRKLRSALSGCIAHVADEDVATGILKAPIQRGDSRTMVRGKRQSERNSNGSLIRDLDAAIALLSRARASLLNLRFPASPVAAGFTTIVVVLMVEVNPPS